MDKKEYEILLFNLKSLNKELLTNEQITEKKQLLKEVKTYYKNTFDDLFIKYNLVDMLDAIKNSTEQEIIKLVQKLKIEEFKNSSSKSIDIK